MVAWCKFKWASRGISNNYYLEEYRKRAIFGWPQMLLLYVVVNLDARVSIPMREVLHD
jgi:hypothetical protein